MGYDKLGRSLHSEPPAQVRYHMKEQRRTALPTGKLTPKRRTGGSLASRTFVPNYHFSNVVNPRAERGKGNRGQGATGTGLCPRRRKHQEWERTVPL